jgi:hypothetical protein
MKVFSHVENILSGERERLETEKKELLVYKYYSPTTNNLNNTANPLTTTNTLTSVGSIGVPGALPFNTSFSASRG